MNGFNFSNTWHKMVVRGFLFAMPWKMKGTDVNWANLPGRQLREGLPILIRGFNTVTEYTKPTDFLHERNLIALNDKHGIGTDASFAQVEGVFRRHCNLIFLWGRMVLKDRCLADFAWNWLMFIILLLITDISTLVHRLIDGWVGTYWIF